MRNEYTTLLQKYRITGGAIQMKMKSILLSLYIHCIVLFIVLVLKTSDNPLEREMSSNTAAETRLESTFRPHFSAFAAKRRRREKNTTSGQQWGEMRKNSIFEGIKLSSSTFFPKNDQLLVVVQAGESNNNCCIVFYFVESSFISSRFIKLISRLK